MSSHPERCRDHGDGGRQTLRKLHDWDSPDPIVVSITDAVERLTGKKSLELDPLYSVVDTEAMAQLLSRGDSCEISFSYANCKVAVDSSGEILVQQY